MPGNINSSVLLLLLVFFSYPHVCYLAPSCNMHQSVGARPGHCDIASHHPSPGLKEHSITVPKRHGPESIPSTSVTLSPDRHGLKSIISTSVTHSHPSSGLKERSISVSKHHGFESILPTSATQSSYSCLKEQSTCISKRHGLESILCTSVTHIVARGVSRRI